jgi:hypothetical protein
VERFEALETPIASQDCRTNALRFAPDRFREAIMTEVNTALAI